MRTSFAILPFLATTLAIAAGARAQEQQPVRYLLDGIQPPIVAAPVTVIAATPVIVTHPVEHVYVDEHVYVSDNRRDAYDTDGILILGIGVGGLAFMSSDAPGATLASRFTIGAAVGPAEFALRFDLAPGLGETDSGKSWGFYTFGASFGYRLLDDADVHPILGIGIEGVSAGEGNGQLAFAATGRIGVELAFPIDDGALALGIDVTGHHAISNDLPGAYTNAITFTVYDHWRF